MHTNQKALVLPKIDTEEVGNFHDERRRPERALQGEHRGVSSPTRASFYQAFGAMQLESDLNGTTLFHYLFKL